MFCFKTHFLTNHFFSTNQVVHLGVDPQTLDLRIQMPQLGPMPSEGNLRGPIEQLPQMMPMSASYQTPLQFAQMMSVPQVMFFIFFLLKVR